MTTPTKLKPPIDVSIPPLHLTEDERIDLCESASIPPNSKTARAFVARVVAALTLHAEMVRRAPDRSLPPHTVAGLDIAASHAAMLSFFLDKNNIAKEVVAVLEMFEVDVAGACACALKVKMAVEEGKVFLSNQCGPGGLARLLSETRDRAMAELAGIHDALSVECGGDDLTEFLTHCAKHLEVTAPKTFARSWVLTREKVNGQI